MGGSKLVDRLTESSINIKLSTVDYEVNYTKENIKLLKIDVEGHELEVMQGSKNLIEMHKPLIIFEQQFKRALDKNILGKSSLLAISISIKSNIVSKKVFMKFNFFNLY